MVFGFLRNPLPFKCQEYNLPGKEVARNVNNFGNKGDPERKPLDLNRTQAEEEPITGTADYFML